MYFCFYLFLFISTKLHFAIKHYHTVGSLWFSCIKILSLTFFAYLKENVFQAILFITVVSKSCATKTLEKLNKIQNIL